MCGLCVDSQHSEQGDLIMFSERNQPLDICLCLVRLSYTSMLCSHCRDKKLSMFSRSACLSVKRVGDVVGSS